MPGSLAYKSQWLRNRQARLKAAGLCTRCGGRRVRRYARCRPCRDRLSQWARDRTEARHRAALYQITKVKQRVDYILREVV